MSRDDASTPAARQFQNRIIARAAQAARRHETEDDVADEVMVADDEDDAWYPRMPKSALRIQDIRDDLRTTSRSLMRKGTQTVVVQKYAIPTRAGALRTTQTEALHRPRHFRPHPVLFLGLALMAMVVGWVLFTIVANWWANTQNTLAYGYPRTYQCDAVVGHNYDSAQNPSHFIALNLHGRIEIIEFPAGDASKAKIYDGPSLVGQNPDLTPVTLSFVDMNGDGKPDMIVHLQGSGQFIWINTGTGFREATSADHVHVPNS